MASLACYADFFEAATGCKPFPYQQRLAGAGKLPDLLHVETGCGKTAAVVLAWLWRRLAQTGGTPRRLVYCLPARVLVEQTCDGVREWIGRLAKSRGVDHRLPSVHVLMGGAADQEWVLDPEREAILVGTQDMLLSRALNRGYAESRFRWPISFGLLNSDCFWVFDEVQLMSTGLATSAQLAAFRARLGEGGNTHSLWMSATLDPAALRTVDFADAAGNLREEGLSAEDRAVPKLADRLAAPKQLTQCEVATDGKGYPKHVAEALCGAHRDGTLTMAVLNTVERAQEVYKAVKRSDPGAEVLLIHSRFRPHERASLHAELKRLGESGGIVVATQVVEAGVDISAQALLTELAPWPSLVQRFGRCNRYGESEYGRVLWVDLDDRNAPPYTPEELTEAREVMREITGRSAAPTELPAVTLRPARDHVLRRKDLLELFDTTPDLFGNDVDVSRFIRQADDHDVQVFWRAWTGGRPDSGEIGQPAREELCSAPLRDVAALTRETDWQRRPWIWDHLQGQWRPAEGRDVRPGRIMLLRCAGGCYAADLGWDARSKREVSPAGPQREAASEESVQDNRETFGARRWVTLVEHTESVVAEMRGLLEGLSGLELPEAHRAALLEAARWHDVGKAHDSFQSMLLSAAEEQERRARSGEIWAKSPHLGLRNAARPHFRHELAAALAFLANRDDGSLASDLTAYLIASHHGRVRMAIRSVPGEQTPDGPGRRYALGVWDGDCLSAVLPAMTEPTTLDLSLMEVGGDDQDRASWLQRTLRLRDQVGPFRLAFLEALLRIADWRASAKEAEGGVQ